jgi:hypothetical protein
MKIEAGKLYAVITGDIVDSSKLPPEKRQHLHKVMKEGSKALRKAFKKDVPMNVDIFRGDSWQMLVSDPSKSLRLGLFYRAYIKSCMELSKVDTRMVIGVGTIDFIPGTKVSEGDGEAYRNSGKMLADISKSVYMRFVFPENEKSAALDIVVQLVDAIARRRWTDRRSLAITGALQGWKQDKIASLWDKPIKQQSVVDNLNGADWKSIEKAINFFEKSLPSRSNSKNRFYSL